MRKIYTLGLLCLLLLTSLAYAQPSGWSYSKTYQVTENSGATLTNYQLKLYVNTQAEIALGHMLASGDDIRFGADCNGATLYNHWIEGPMNDDSTVIWVKIPTIPASGNASFFMYYGNPSATTTSAVQGTFIGPHSATDSVASGAAGGVAGSQRGFRFSPTQDLLVTSFGKREPTGTTRYVTLFNYATQAILNQIQVSGAAAQYNYGSLPNPIWLTTGTQYVLELFQGTGDGYYFGTSSQIGQHLTYLDMRYCNSCTQNTFPTSVLTNYHYGYPDLWYFTRSVVTPAPTYAIIPAGAISVTASDISGCQGDTATLLSTVVGGTAPITCQWSNGLSLSDSTNCNPIATIGSTLYHVLTVTDQAGCTARDTAFVTNGTPTLALAYDTTVVCAGDTVMIVASGSGDSYSWSPADSLSSTSGSTVMAWPNLTTSYVCTTTDSATGCTTLGTATVNTQFIILNVILGPLAMCEGDSLTLTVSGADTYVWSPALGLSSTTGSVVIASPASSTIYSITGTDTTSGCATTSQGAYEVLVFPNPVVTFDLVDHFCVGGADELLTTGTPAGGTYSGPLVSNNTFGVSGATVGSYPLLYTFTDGNGCSASDSALAIVEICIGVSPSVNVTLGVYPNPSTGMFTVSMTQNPEVASYRISNLLGQVVQKGMLAEGQTQLDLSGQATGLYILTVETGGQVRNFNLEIRR
jgi:Domain of unknown function (DUF2341)/Secretion system C-terminal sorting domain